MGSPCYFLKGRKKKNDFIIKFKDNKALSEIKNDNKFENINKNFQKNNNEKTNNKIYEFHKYNNNIIKNYNFQENNNDLLEIKNHFFEDNNNNTNFEENRKNLLIEEYKKIKENIKDRNNNKNLNSILLNITERIEENFGFIKEIKNELDQTKYMMISCKLSLEDRQIINNITIYEFINDQEEYKKYFNEIISKNREEIKEMIKKNN